MEENVETLLYLKHSHQMKTSLGIPQPIDIEPGRKIPQIIFADDAFPLKEYIMKPCGSRNLTLNQRIFNYHFGRASRTVGMHLEFLLADFEYFHLRLF